MVKVTGIKMKNKQEILDHLKEIKEITVELRLKTNVITKEEYSKFIDKLERTCEKTIELIDPR